MCLTPGSHVQTPTGKRPVQSLQVGDLVDTRDHGPQPLRWRGERTLLTARVPEQHPIFVAQGALGPSQPSRDMMLSPRHKLLIRAGSDMEEALAPASMLRMGPAVHAVPLNRVTYISLLFDAHEIILADGLWVESLQPRAPCGQSRLPDHPARAVGPARMSIAEEHATTALRVA